MEFALSTEERERFARDGWLGPYPLMDPGEGRRIAPALKAWHDASLGHPYDPQAPPDGRFAEKPWYMSLHTGFRRVWELGAEPAVLDRVRQLIGDDVILWGSSYFGQEHEGFIHWHGDLEYQCWTGVAAWIALHDVTETNVLKLMPGSHRWSETPESLMMKRGLTIGDLRRDEQALAFARELDPEAEVARPSMQPGEFILFQGNMWHASYNPDPVYRSALNLRYSPTSEHVRIPINFVQPAKFDPTPPPCILMSGEDRYGHNRLVEPPAA